MYLPREDYTVLLEFKTFLKILERGFDPPKVFKGGKGSPGAIVPLASSFFLLSMLRVSPKLVLGPRVFYIFSSFTLA